MQKSEEEVQVTEDWIQMVFECSEREVEERLMRNNTSYQKLQKESDELVEKNPFLEIIMEGDEELSLSREELKTLQRFMKVRAGMDYEERKAYLFQGHKNCIEYFHEMGFFN